MSQSPPLPQLPQRPHKSPSTTPQLHNLNPGPASSSSYFPPPSSNSTKSTFPDHIGGNRSPTAVNNDVDADTGDLASYAWLTGPEAWFGTAGASLACSSSAPRASTLAPDTMAHELEERVVAVVQRLVAGGEALGQPRAGGKCAYWTQLGMSGSDG